MTAELYRGRSKTSSFQFEGEMVSGFNAGNRIGTGKRASIDWSGLFRAARRKIANSQDAPSLALVIGVHRDDKPLKSWLHIVAQMLPNSGALPDNEATHPNVSY